MRLFNGLVSLVVFGLALVSLENQASAYSRAYQPEPASKGNSRTESFRPSGKGETSHRENHFPGGGGAPEPASLLLLAAGGGIVGFKRYRARKAAKKD